MIVEFMVAGDVDHRLAAQCAGITLSSEPFYRGSDWLIDVTGENRSVEFRQVDRECERPEL